MKIEQVKELTPLGRLIYWCNERQQIKLKKDRGYPWPWTDDVILQKYRFCNVRRIDDKVSQWLLHQWYEPYLKGLVGTPTVLSLREEKTVLVMATMARHFNLPEALDALGHPMKWYRFEDWLESARAILKNRKERGLNNFNSAYVVSGGTGGGQRGDGLKGDKIDIVIDKVIKPLIEKPPAIDTSSMQRTHERLCTYPGLGSFMAGQIVADLRWAMPGEWRDKDLWAPQGPGSTRGLCRLYGLPVDKHGLDDREFRRRFEDMMRRAKPHVMVKDVEAMDWQSVCCEYDKYCRALLGEGRPKANYSPPNRTKEMFS